MSFINPEEYNISFSDISNMRLYDNCPFLINESETVEGEKFIQTEDGLIVDLEGVCEVSLPEDIDCHSLCREGFVDSGFFSLVNTCSLPITVTGFSLTDPERFSLYDPDKYRGTKIYDSSLVDQLPITIKPRKKISIDTFFHPKYEELEFGNAGSITNRTGDKFGSLVEIYPGFRLSNCDKNGACDAYVTLTGEFLCLENEDNMEWMYNTKNIDPLFDKESLFKGQPEINNTSFILKKPSFYETAASNSAHDIYQGLKNACTGYARYLEQNLWYDLYSDYGVTGSLGAFHDIVDNILNSEENSILTIENTNQNGSLVFTAEDGLGTQGDDISISLLYGQTQDLISENGDQIEIQRVATNNEDASVLQSAMNSSIQNGDVTKIQSCELLNTDGEIEEFSELLSGGVDTLSDSLLNLTANDFNKTYIQMSHDYFQLITFVTNFTANNTVTLNYKNKTYKGMLFNHSSNPAPPVDVGQVPFITNQVMFYRMVNQDIEIFLCDFGDFNNDIIVE